MSTVTDAPVGPGVRTRVGEVLRNWGKKIPAIAKKAGNWFMRGLKKSAAFVKRVGKWALEAKATQWVLDKTRPAWNKAWPIIKGPILWLAAPIIALIAMPKLVAALLIILGVLVVLLAFALWRTYKSSNVVKGKVYTDQEWDALGDPEMLTYSSTTRTKKDGTVETEVWEMKSVKDAKGNLKIYFRNHDKVVTGEPKVRTRFGKDLKAEGFDSTLDTSGLSLNGDPTPGETVSLRYKFLDEQLAKAGEDKDEALMCEAMARMNLIEVRKGMVETKVKADARAQVIHGEFRKWATATYPQITWDWGLMYRAAVSESTRLTELDKMQELAKAS